MSIAYVIGIDEAGRGPVAGPIAVGAVCAPVSLTLTHEYFEKGIKDSKKLTAKRRDVLFDWIEQHGELRQAVGFVSAADIDTYGIVPATKRAMEDALKRVLPETCSKNDVMVLLDGGLRAPDSFSNQTTIIRGDESEVLIALASAMAKVTRDREMERLALEHPNYGLERHKGYGTKAHYAAIEQYGLCAEHRRSFLRNIA